VFGNVVVYRDDKLLVDVETRLALLHVQRHQAAVRSYDESALSLAGLEIDVPALVESSPVCTERSVKRALELANETTDAASGLLIELADMVGGDVVADGADVVAVLAVLGDDTNVGHAGVAEVVDLAVEIGDVADLPETALAS
jgi:hypothetical protein